MNEQATAEELQAWVARSISVKQELQTKIQQLREAALRSESLLLMDLLKFSISKAQKAEAEVGRLNNQNKSLQQKLDDVTNELKDCYQELSYTNQELSNALQSEHLTPRQAQELAKTLLEREEPTREALAKLLSAIYGLPINPWELQRQLMSSVRLNPSSQDGVGKLSSQRIQLSQEALKFQTQCHQLAARFAALESQITRLQAQYYHQSEKFNALSEAFALVAMPVHTDDCT